MIELTVIVLCDKVALESTSTRVTCISADCLQCGLCVVLTQFHRHGTLITGNYSCTVFNVT